MPRDAQDLPPVSASEPRECGSDSQHPTASCVALAGATFYFRAVTRQGEQATPPDVLCGLGDPPGVS